MNIKIIPTVQGPAGIQIVVRIEISHEELDDSPRHVLVQNIQEAICESVMTVRADRRPAYDKATTHRRIEEINKMLDRPAREFGRSGQLNLTELLAELARLEALFDG